MSLHLLNSLLLTASIAMTSDFAAKNQWTKRIASPWSFEGLKPKRIINGLLFSFLLIALSGAIAALAGTLFPSSSLLAGLQADWDPNSHFLIRLRGLHPLFGIFFGGSLTLTAWLSIQLQKPNETVLADRSRYLAFAGASAIVFGIGTLLLLAPTWMRLSHLALAHTVWIFLILWIREVLYPSTATANDRS